MGTIKFDRTKGFKVVLTTDTVVTVPIPFEASYITFATDQLVNIGLDVEATGILTDNAYQDGEFQLAIGGFTAPEQGFKSKTSVSFKRAASQTTTVHMVIFS